MADLIVLSHSSKLFRKKLITVRNTSRILIVLHVILEFLLKYAELSKYFNPNIQLELEKTDIDFKMYTRKSFDASLIFYKDL